MFLVDQFCSSLLNNILQIVSIFFQLLNHSVHYVKLSTTNVALQTSQSHYQIWISSYLYILELLFSYLFDVMCHIKNQVQNLQSYVIRKLMWLLLIKKCATRSKCFELYTKWNSKKQTDFPLLIIFRDLVISLNEGRSDGSSAQHCFISVKMPGCTPSDSCWGIGGR